MKWKLTIGFLLVMGISFLDLSPRANAGPDFTKEHRIIPQGEKKALLELIRKWEEKYNVLFTYDRRIVESVEVEVSEEGAENIDMALEMALHHTELKYTILEDRYVILYKNDKEGIESLDNMIQHLSRIIDSEKTSLAKRESQIVNQLHTHSTLDVYQKRLVINITGTVKNQAGEPLIGVNILVKGTNKGTSTEFDGRFVLEDVEEHDVLIVSYIGYQSREIPISGRRDLTITLQEDLQTLDEVVVVGYGTVKKSDLTGSVSSIRAEELEKQGPRINFVQALQGVAPGLNITQSGNSASSGSIDIQIRGQNSILASNSPLVILDGVPYDGGLTLLDQSMIASIEILKDASSAAIYGARGANGVILITTKEGQQGVPKFSYEGSYGIKQIYGLPDLMTGPEHWQFGVDRYGESAISNNYPTRVENYQNGVSTDWVKEATRLGLQNKHTAGISGGF